MIDAIKKNKTRPSPIYRVDIMGSLSRFEDVRPIHDNIYELILGS